MDFCGLPKICELIPKRTWKKYTVIIGKSHARFRDECILAKNNHCKLIVLVENENNISCLDEVHNGKILELKDIIILGKCTNKEKAQNVKLASKPPCSGKQLQSAMETMTEKYGVEFRFCNKKECGNLIIDLLVNFKGE